MSPGGGLIVGSNRVGGKEMSTNGSYEPKQFNLSGLKGISDQTLEMHFKLYEGYVKETNKLTEKISEFLADVDQIEEVEESDPRDARDEMAPA